MQILFDIEHIDIFCENWNSPGKGNAEEKKPQGKPIIGESDYGIEKTMLKTIQMFEMQELSQTIFADKTAYYIEIDKP